MESSGRENQQSTPAFITSTFHPLNQHWREKSYQVFVLVFIQHTDIYYTIGARVEIYNWSKKEVMRLSY
jgi:hypothetical protein